jgi:hypothetical protein
VDPDFDVLCLLMLPANVIASIIIVKHGTSRPCMKALAGEEFGCSYIACSGT